MDDGISNHRGAVAISAPNDPRSLRRLEDARFLTGQGRYLDDMDEAGHLFAAILRSPHGHATILAIDTSAAAAMPGVRGVFTEMDLAADGVGPLPTYIVVQTEKPLIIPPRYALARGKVRHVGDPVAFVVADSRDAARDAAEAIEVSYDILPATVDPATAQEPDRAQIWDEAPGNVAYRFRKGDRDKVAAAFAAAAHVIECDLINNRIAAAALETRAAIGSFDEVSGVMHLELSGASVHAIRRELAEGVFQVPLDRITVACPDVGGGFGMKNVLYPEYALVLFAARKLKAPVRWVAERIDDFTCGVHGRDNVTKAKLAIDADGKFLALAVETIGNLGAYISSLGPGSSTNAPSTAMGGLYDIPAITMDVHGVFTNTAPVDAYRGAGKPEANYIIERLIDIAAHQLGRDPVDLRRRNLICHFPHRTALGQSIDCGTFTDNLETALELADHAGLAKRKAASAARGKLRGLGVGCFLETSRGQPNEEAWLSFSTDEVIDLAVGTQSNGQGHETSFVQLASDWLGLPLAAFRLVQGDTRRVPRGGGHGGARSLHMGGTALVLAIDDLLERARPIAAQLLQAEIDQVQYTQGAFRCPADAGGGLRSVDLFAVARSVSDSNGEALGGHGDNRCDIFTFPNGCHVAEVEIDPETGHVSLERYLAVDDYGRLLNPLLTESQVQGGVAQGIGQALMEHSVYDAESGQLLSATFMDYAMPRGVDLPDLTVRLVEVPTKANPLGAKGSGQAGSIGAPHTVMNAVLDALRPVGVEQLDMPATPARVWQAIETARKRIAS